MEYHLEREIRLLKSNTLQECDGDGLEVGSEQSYWGYNLFFVATEIRYGRSIKTDDEAKEKNSIIETESILAILHPGGWADKKWGENSIAFSMFGTGRKIENFNLVIKKLDGGDKSERCKADGGVRRTYEHDYLNVTSDDFVQIDLWLSPQRFNNLAEDIKTEAVDCVQLRLSSVSGCYSECTPCITTESVKVLLDNDSQKVVRPENCDFTLLRLGEIDDFDLTILKRCRLTSKNLEGL